MNIQARLLAAGLPPLTRSAWLEIDVPALAGNIRAIAAHVGDGAEIWPVVKADGYGHGLEVAARTFRGAGAQGLCVATLDEAEAVRAAGVDGSILILYPVPPAHLEAAARNDFRLAVSTVEGALALVGSWRASGAASTGSVLRVHLEVDTGLTRMGVWPEQVADLTARLDVPGLSVEAVWSHLATPEDPFVSADQEHRLADAVVAAGSVRHDPTAHHLAATGGLLTGRGARAGLVRPGLLAYGVAPGDDWVLLPGLRPAMRLKAQAARIVEVPAGTRVGYGGTWVAHRPATIATLPVGYGDGFVRSYARAAVLVRGVRAPVVGTVAMDALMVDVTGIQGLTLDDEFVLLGPQGHDAVTCLELARLRNTIPWEVLTGMARRPTRVYDAGVGLLGVRTLAGETLVRDTP